MGAHTFVGDHETMLRLLEELARTGMTRAALGRRLGVSSQAFNNWLSRGFPRARTTDVAQRLGWSVDRLLGTSHRAEEPPAAYGDIDLQRQMLALDHAVERA